MRVVNILSAAGYAGPISQFHSSITNTDNTSCYGSELSPSVGEIVQNTKSPLSNKIATILNDVETPNITQLLKGENRASTIKPNVFESHTGQVLSADNIDLDVSNNSNKYEILENKTLNIWKYAINSNHDNNVPFMNSDMAQINYRHLELDDEYKTPETLNAAVANQFFKHKTDVQSTTELCDLSANCALDNNYTEGSLTSPEISKNSYFPRGITNPNYPGFQHFAHTLSEHFLEKSSSESCESDMSDYEMELTSDSLEEFEAEQEECEYISNSNNNNNVSKYKANNLSKLTKSTKNSSAESVLDINFNTHDTETDNVKHFQDVTNDYDSDVSDIHAETKKNQLKNYLPTPDILIKNGNENIDLLLEKPNKPDLLHGVSAQVKKNKEVECQKTIVRSAITFEGAQSKASHCKGIADTTNDEISLGVTPVDIIGNFGQEVEREFGLLVSGYKKVVDVAEEHPDNNHLDMNEIEKVSDASLSNAKEILDTEKLFVTVNEFKLNSHHPNCISAKCTKANENADSNGRSLSCDSPLNAENNLTVTSKVSTETDIRSDFKYRKPSYDERQLPPVAIDYKRCQQSLKNLRKYRNFEGTKESNLTSLHSTRKNNNKFNAKNARNVKSGTSNLHAEEDHKFYQYQELVSDKESILSNSKYSKMSTWAIYLGSERKNNPKKTTELISPSSLDLFDAYKIGMETDKKTLQEHLKLAKEIEQKRRNDREETCRRLAMGVKEIRHQYDGDTVSKQKNPTFSESNSDTESHSSDSETCPKLSRLSIRSNNACNDVVIYKQTNRIHQLEAHNIDAFVSNEDKECDFFTRQARLQIETRTALAQAKQMAHLQMEIERQHQCVSPITKIIRNSLEHIGITPNARKRRLSRQLLTHMNITQLQILVNSLYAYIEEFNEALMNLLMQRDDRHFEQDSLMADIEELTRYIGTNEHMVK